ncbi:hypothetical protein R69746_07449 [Paraburkholderia aspalathi]|nr:hypothetical protein R69746_07449 [Paraburkholderia aspalathi]
MTTDTTQSRAQFDGHTNYLDKSSSGVRLHIAQ